MRFMVETVEERGCMTIVSGKTTVGTIKGIWKGKEPPVFGKGYHIELNIDYPEEVNIPQKGKYFPAVCFNNDVVTFKGICESMDEDVYYLRFDVDWIEMLEIGDIASKKKPGDYISFSASIYGITIYPYTL